MGLLIIVIVLAVLALVSGLVWLRMRKRRRLNGLFFSSHASVESGHLDAIGDDDLLAGDDAYESLAHMSNNDNHSVAMRRELDELFERLSAEGRTVSRSVSADWLEDSDDNNFPMAVAHLRMDWPEQHVSRISLADRYSSHDIPPTGVPFSRREGSLPHDGLFIRRNNAFGTRSAVGVTDLIDQGVLIDQTNIRFDDFVVSKADQVPMPAVGEAIKVSHGSCPTVSGVKAHEATTHFVEIALRAGQAPTEGIQQHEVLPVNFVFVVDTSGSMSGEKLDTVRTAIRELYAQLRDGDILGIVTFDTQVRTVLPAMSKSEITTDSLTSVLAGLSARGGTDINLGVLYGIDEITRHADGRAAIVNCLYLFSDGDPTSGETDWIKIRTNIAARLRGELTISGFGFGSDARMRELEALAGLTGGFATFVTNANDVRLNLVEDLARREHLAAINIQLQIEIDPDITIWHLYGHDLITDPATRAQIEQAATASAQQARDELGVQSLPHLITEEKGIRIFAPDLAHDETYWIVLELQVPPDRASAGLGMANVQYVDVPTRANRQYRLDLSESTIPKEIVFAHAVGLWTSEITFYALDDLYQNDRETAKNRLSNHIQLLSGASSLVPAMQFSQDQVTFRKFITLASNLGQVRSWTDYQDRDVWRYTTHAMNQFGQVRSGFIRTRYDSI